MSESCNFPPSIIRSHHKQQGTSVKWKSITSVILLPYSHKSKCLLEGSGCKLSVSRCLASLRVTLTDLCDWKMKYMSAFKRKRVEEKAEKYILIIYRPENPSRSWRLVCCLFDAAKMLNNDLKALTTYCYHFPQRSLLLSAHKSVLSVVRTYTLWEQNSGVWGTSLIYVSLSAAPAYNSWNLKHLKSSFKTQMLFFFLIKRVWLA